MHHAHFQGLLLAGEGEEAAKAPSAGWPPDGQFDIAAGLAAAAGSCRHLPQGVS